MPGVTSPPSPARVLSQQADLRLRGMQVRVIWPPATPAGAPALLVFLGDDEELCCELAVRIPAVVLTVRPRDDPCIALEWAADHAGELRADPGRLIVAGEPALAADLERRARERGWPVIAEVLAT
jgi:hypothetical protein